MTVLLVVLGVGLLAGLPIYAVLAIGCLVYVMVEGIPAMIAVQTVFDGVTKFPLLAVPFFILAGNIMNASGLTERIFGFAQTLVGSIRGGLAHVNITASLLFSGMSGASVADAAGLGTIEVKAMTDAGYPRPFSAGISAASSTIGSIIPPSISLVIFAILANVSVGQLFAAGIVPGLLMALALHVLVVIIAARRQFPREPRPPFAVFLRSLFSSSLALLMPFILLGGMFSGVFTATEAAAAACVYAIAIGALAYRTLTWKKFIEALFDTLETTAVVMILVGTAALFGWILVREGVAPALAQMLLSATPEPWVILLLLNLLMLVAGLFLETTAAMLVLTPILLPIVDAIGLDRVQFGIIMTLNLAIGMLTPPIGILIFVMARVARIGVMDTIRGTLPFLVPLIIVLGLVTAFSPLTLALPRLIYGD